jgi:SAM-dependent methyltransferase
MSAAWFRRRTRPKPYRAEDFRRRDRYRSDYLALGRWLAENLDFSSVLDVGCANGFLMEGLESEGRTISGIELSPAVVEVLPAELRERVRIGDFSDARGSWDLVCCVEVAEHIEAERSQELVAKLAELAEHWIYFTAAPPGQTGRGHINCRPHDEWLAWFADAGWQPNAGLTGELRAVLGALSETPWLERNSFLLTPEPAGP